MDEAGGSVAADGLVRRPATQADEPALADLGRRIGLAIDDEPVMSAADVAADFARPDLDPAVDTRIIEDGATGRVHAYGIAYDEFRGRGSIDPLVDPELPSTAKDELLDELLAWGIDRMAAFGERRGLDQTVAVVAAARDEHRMFEAYARHGFSYARTFWRMHLDLSLPHPAPNGLPGCEVEQVDPRTDEALVRLHALDQAAFAEHWGFVPQTAQETSVHIRAFAGLDPAGTWIVRDVATDRDAGFLIASDRTIDQGHGYVDVLGVIPEYRGRGIARELLATAFAYYRVRGMTGVSLGVDADNSTGATALYRGVGMREQQVWDLWELALTLTVEPDED
jgi:ribosomal protein S18 acetylase RimI-like enzyme